MVVTTLTATDFLTGARDFIANPEHWCQGHLAVDEFDNPLASARTASAAKCCAVGSLQRTWFCVGSFEVSAYQWAGELLDRAAEQVYPESADRADLGPAAYVNDKLGHAAILRVYDAAIAASQEVH